MLAKKNKGQNTVASTERKNDDKKLISKDSSFEVRESYKELRTNILFSLPEKTSKRILVTSSIASEGKSTNCVNLAITFAEAGVKTLIVDCDLRCPNVAKLLNDYQKKGLSNVLVNDCTLETAIHPTKYENLDVVLAGEIPPNPTELLSSDAMAEFIDKVSQNYEYIFFDAPPVDVVTDAVIISSMVSGVIIVCRQYVTEKKFLNSAIEKLRFAKAKILGVVLNDVVMSKAGYGRYSKYGKYSSYARYGSYNRYSKVDK